MLQLFKGIALEADSILNDLQRSLLKQETKLTAYAQQQAQVRDFWFVGRTSELEMLNSLLLHVGTCQSSEEYTSSF